MNWTPVTSAALSGLIGSRDENPPVAVVQGIGCEYLVHSAADGLPAEVLVVRRPNAGFVAPGMAALNLRRYPARGGFGQVLRDLADAADAEEH